MFNRHISKRTSNINMKFQLLSIGSFGPSKGTIVFSSVVYAFACISRQNCPLRKKNGVHRFIIRFPRLLHLYKNLHRFLTTKHSNSAGFFRLLALGIWSLL